jgi:hypothetical protein
LLIINEPYPLVEFDLGIADSEGLLPTIDGIYFTILSKLVIAMDDAVDRLY